MTCICGFSHNCGTVCLVKIRNHHPRALVQKTQDGRASHTAGPAGDHRDFAFKSHAASSVSVCHRLEEMLYILTVFSGSATTGFSNSPSLSIAILTVSPGLR